MKTTVLLIAATVVVVAAAQSDTAFIEAKGTVISKTLVSGEFPSVNVGDPVTLDFSVGSGSSVEGSLLKRGYTM